MGFSQTSRIVVSMFQVIGPVEHGNEGKFPCAVFCGEGYLVKLQKWISTDIS